MQRLMAACFMLLMITAPAEPRSPEPTAARQRWTGADVGRVGTAGKHSEKDGVFTLNGAGGGVFIAGDAYYYVYLPLKGDFDVTARAVSMKNGVANSTLGL